MTIENVIDFLRKSSNEDMKKGLIKEFVMTVEIDNGHEQYGILLTLAFKE